MVIEIQGNLSSDKLFIVYTVGKTAENFDDEKLRNKFGPISRIELSSGGILDGFKASYGYGHSVQHGGAGPNDLNLLVSQSNPVVGVEGCLGGWANEECVSALTFKFKDSTASNSMGGIHNPATEFKCYPPVGYYLSFIRGSSKRYVNSLEFVFELLQD